MKSILTAGGIHTFISVIENELLGTYDFNNKVYKESLNERELEITKGLVHKGVLNLHLDEDKSFYLLNIDEVSKWQ